MNNTHFSPSSNSYSLDYSSPTLHSYYYSRPVTPCPIHSAYPFYSSTTPSISTSPPTYSYYQQQSAQMYPVHVEQYAPVAVGHDRTPLRRHRCFKKTELQTLQHAYNQDRYPSIDVLEQLALQLNVSIEKVRQWFKNRRHSDKQKQRKSVPKQILTTVIFF